MICTAGGPGPGTMGHRATGPQGTLGKLVFSCLFLVIFEILLGIFGIVGQLLRFLVEKTCFQFFQTKPCRIISNFRQKISFEPKTCEI